MSDLYNRISMLCQEKGVSIGKMCAALEMSRGNMTELKMERIKTLKTDNLTKIAVYFGVSVDYLLGTEQKEMPPNQLIGGRSFEDDPVYQDFKRTLEDIQAGRGKKGAMIMGYGGKGEFIEVDEEEYQKLRAFIEVSRAKDEQNK